MSQTVDHVDDASLAEAAKVLGTASPQDTVNAALREVVRLKMVGLYVRSLKDRVTEDPDAERNAAWR